MNIRITHNWLKEYLETDATQEQMQKYLSLCGPSIERIEGNGNDYIYDVEVTSNRIDTASVYGIARETSAILPQYGIKAKLKPFTTAKPKKISSSLPFSLNDDHKLTKRVVSVVMDNVQVAKSPQYIKDRLEAAGIRSLNNIIDITNYVMIELGHPTHVMDYDRMKTGKLVIRNSKKGESIITLDGKRYELDSLDVVADDGTGRIVDLLGIMGLENSVVTAQTKRVVIFIESNDPQTIRRTSMRLGIRTQAAIYDEKHVDSELTITALYRVIELFQKIANAKLATNPVDIYNIRSLKKTVSISMNDLDRIIGVEIKKHDAVTILKNLGFELVSDKNNTITVSVPSFRSHDVSIKEDLVEEVARIYGYQNIPGALQPMVYIRQPKDVETLFEGQSKIKYFLKHLGLHEVMNYSMISKQIITAYDFDPENYLRLSNTISEEIEYMRRTLLTSLVKNLKENEGKREDLRFFEVAKTYLPKTNDLPNESYQLGIAVNTSFSDLRGIIDALFSELHIDNAVFKKSSIHTLFNKNVQGEIYFGGKLVCVFGKLHKKYEVRQELTKPAYLAQFDVYEIINLTKQFPKYQPINQYATIKFDLTIEMREGFVYQELREKALKTSHFLNNLEVIDVYKNKLSLRFYFSSDTKNLTEEEAKKELEKIKELV